MWCGAPRGLPDEGFAARAAMYLYDGVLQDGRAVLWRGIPFTIPLAAVLVPAMTLAVVAFVTACLRTRLSWKRVYGRGRHCRSHPVKNQYARIASPLLCSRFVGYRPTVAHVTEEAAIVFEECQGPRGRSPAPAHYDESGLASPADVRSFSRQTTKEEEAGRSLGSISVEEALLAECAAAQSVEPGSLSLRWREWRGSGDEVISVDDAARRRRENLSWRLWWRSLKATRQEAEKAGLEMRRCRTRVPIRTRAVQGVGGT